MYHKAEDNPCYGCTERQYGCHSGCQRHKEYKAQLEAEKEREMAGRRRDYPEMPKRKKWKGNKNGN